MQPNVQYNLRQAQIALTENKVAVYYVVPKDAEYVQAEYDAIRNATRDIQAWFQINTGGVTYTFAFPDTVMVYRALENTSYYQDSWFFKITDEMAAQGHPIWQPGIVASLWIKSGRADGLGEGMQACDGYCGVATTAVENFPEFNYFNRCPTDPNGIMWPCVPHGTMAHELGHAFGLPHPDEVDSTREFAFHSIMRAHWNYPNGAPDNLRPWGLLTVERTTLWANPFFYEDISLKQIYDADIVNLPVTGSPPAVSFTSSINNLTVDFSNSTEDAVLYYWTFGDGSGSNEESPTHTYSSPGTYTVTLRASSESGMTAMQQQTIEVTDKKKPVAKTIHVGPIKIYPNPSTDGRFTVTFPPLPFTFRLLVHDAMGQPILDQTLSGSSRSLELDLNSFGQGVYYVRLEMRGARLTQRLVVL